MERNILCVVAHPDDAEIMAGGALLKWKEQGAKTHVVVLTDGCGINPNGQPTRLREDALYELQEVAKLMKYDSCEVFNEINLALAFKDETDCELLKRISAFNIDTIITCWDKDTNHDHFVVPEMVKMVARRVPRVLMGQVNYYLYDFFAPNLYVDISSFWEKKLEAIKLYKSAWDNHAKDWHDFLDATSTYYGKIVHVERAEGFITNRYLI